jgi:hypothetical protein
LKKRLSWLRTSSRVRIQPPLATGRNGKRLALFDTVQSDFSTEIEALFGFIRMPELSLKNISRLFSVCVNNEITKRCQGTPHSFGK